MDRRTFSRLMLASAALPALPRAARAVVEWDGITDIARGQTVWWHAWGGDPKINDFITWVGELALERYGVTLNQVKIASTADSVAAVLAERDAGKTTGGSVDLIWINGENFAAMKREGLLYGPFVENLPNWPLVDMAGKPAVMTDFTLPTEGYESPWAMAQLVFEYDSARLTDPPRTIEELKDWILANPGRFTFPKPPDYLGVTFLKQVLYGTMPDPSVLQRPANPATFRRRVAPLRDFLATVRDALWREGRAYPENEAALGQLLADGEIDISFAFNPGRASAEIAAGTLPDTIRTYTLKGGTIGNASFVAIPFNSNAKEGAQVIANLLLSPEVQARAQDATVLGFQTVLNLAALTEEDRARFAMLDLGLATLPPDKIGPALLEPHASWATALADDWTALYGSGD
ncbi:ABC transporter substrate-binding protein [Fuscovulum blasticum]|uniref:ABC transporter substrate-binding protein n=1 Tax=Fuscovulum blasticum TaxID=1075 RepID=UPI000D5050DD|nr:ABC transporter substrate-binding protein [Fuscovulum blasticum]AWD20984.1 ABC transporter substrate-binding protein [Fuscovulum blasticum]